MNFKLFYESRQYFGQKISFIDDDGKQQIGTIIDPGVLEKQQTRFVFGPHIVDEWFGANVNSNNGNRNFDDKNPFWYIVKTKDGKHQWDYHIVSAEHVEQQMIKNKLTPNTKETFSDLIDEL
jgi:hypothetical protein